MAYYMFTHPLNERVSLFIPMSEDAAFFLYGKRQRYFDEEWEATNLCFIFASAHELHYSSIQMNYIYYQML
ncbi:unnamed protein product [Urochloa humidicola]